MNATRSETTNVIIHDLRNDFFSILVDESRDVEVKEQIAILLHYINKKGSVIERFLGIVHVNNTTSLSLKIVIQSLFSKYGLSLAKLCGQGYDGASNMRG